MSVLLTRDGDALAPQLEARGLHVYSIPLIRTVELPPPALDLAGFDWVVVTSVAAVRALARRFDLSQGRAWAAVGPATAQALRAAGVAEVVVPAEPNGLAIADALGDVAGRRLLLARGDLAAADLPDRLRELGGDVVEVTVYRTEVGPADSKGPLAAALADPELRAAVYASGSALYGAVALAGEAARRVPAVSIGPRTTAVARELGFQVAGEAATPSELLDAVLEVIGRG
jgi:uroporphyrinogen-III synthase